MTNPRFEALDWVDQGNALLTRARTTLESANRETSQALAARVPTTIIDEERPIVLVLAGQYSAGKSTILRVLTGRDDIATGAAVTTQQAQTYEWQGIRVVDTPGVHTQLRPDHDEIAYRAIAEADLLMFVVTNELFDKHLAQHFRKLAIEQDKAHEMLLVVNKMRRAAGGNTPQTQAVIAEDLARVLSPYSTDDLRTCFVDAEAALQSAAEQDTALARALERKSGVATFIETLNGFVRDQGLTARYTTALYALEQVLQEGLCGESSGDDEVQGLEELLLQRRRTLTETQAQIPAAVDTHVQAATSDIRREGREVAELIHGSANQQEVDARLQSAQERVEARAAELGEAVQKVIAAQMSKQHERLEQIAESELAQELLRQLTKRLGTLALDEQALGKLRKTSEISGKLGEFLVRTSFSPKATTLGGLFKLNQYSGTATHSAVKVIGRFFGKSFKPWEAVKWTRGIANVGRVLSVAGTVLSFALQIKEDIDAERQEKDLREARGAIRSGFNEAAHAIEMHYDETSRSYVANTVTKDLGEVDAQLEELQAMKESKTAHFDELKALLDETRAMIQRLHREQQ